MTTIERMFVFIAVDKDGNEGVAAMYNESDKRWLPLVVSQEDMIEKVMPMARQIMAITGKTITVAEFSHRVDREKLV